MAVHPAQSLLTGGLYGTPEMRAVFSDEARVQRMLDVEAALARAQAALGLIPAEAAAAITAAAKAERVDIAKIGASAVIVGYPVIGLVKALGQAAGPEAARWVHWGATTQDILDTATILQMRDGLALIERDLARTIRGLAALARTHRDTPMAGRTHLQHALPITFGAKVAVWMQPLLRSLVRLRAVRQEIAVVQFGGAVGTLASLGDRGGETIAGLARELGLGTTPAPWHVDRGLLADAVAALGVLGGGLAKIATDVILLMQTEVGEVAEPHQAGRGGSSTMPQKRNPIACEYILATVRGLHAAVPLMLGAMAQDQERGTGPWQSEDLAIPQAFVLAHAALAHAAALAEGMTVDAARMRANLDLTGGLILAEQVMMRLAPAIGREAAHHRVQHCCDRAIAARIPLLDALLADPEVTAALSRHEIAAALDPAGYLGRSGAMVDAVLAEAARVEG